MKTKSKEQNIIINIENNLLSKNSDDNNKKSNKKSNNGNKSGLGDKKDGNGGGGGGSGGGIRYTSPAVMTVPENPYKNMINEANNRRSLYDFRHNNIPFYDSSGMLTAPPSNPMIDYGGYGGGGGGGVRIDDISNEDIEIIPNPPPPEHIEGAPPPPEQEYTPSLFTYRNRKFERVFNEDGDYIGKPTDRERNEGIRDNFIQKFYEATGNNFKGYREPPVSDLVRYGLMRTIKGREIET